MSTNCSYSPYKAFYGYDRTHIKRITVAEYLGEDENAIPLASSGLKGDADRGRNGLLNSRDPSVVFHSKFPVHDCHGRELCVLYQMIESEVQHEIRRIEMGGCDTRKSTVCFVSKHTTNEETPNPVGPCAVKQEERDAVKERERHSEASTAYRPTPYVYLPSLSYSDSTLEVSPSTHCFSDVAVSSQPEARTTAATDVTRASSFSVYRDSGPSPYVKPLLEQEQQSHGILPQSEVMSDGRHSAFPPGLATCDLENEETTDKSIRPISVPPPQRSSTASPARCGGVADNEEEVAHIYATTLFDKLSTDTNVGPVEALAMAPTGALTTRQLLSSVLPTAPQRVLQHPTPIQSQVYGTHSQVIPAVIVTPFINANIEAFCAGGDFFTSNAPTPQLDVGKVLILEGHFYRIAYYHASADVYEAREMAEGPTQGVPSVTMTTASGEVFPQTLIYRWRISAMQQDVNEAHCAALGLSYVTGGSSLVRVSGCRYSDGGLTVITLQKGYRSVPLSSVPITPRSFPTCVRLLLRMMLDLVARRTVHGTMRGMNQIFFAMSLERGAQDVESAAFLIPVHWERLVDFSMFADRNAGHTIPLADGDGSTEGERVYHGQDVAMLVNMLLNSENAVHLQQHQVVELRQLVTHASETTQIAKYLVQLNRAIATIPPDMAALRVDYEAALQFSC
uniref:Kinetoplastid kinetochore protein 14 n=1 Tax=Trypanosoma congolense (strain IL3000) TaxID=1068625 RepID=G0UWT1_TRYCI|nr:conserved hypothetical protein [Trypanosoma congolense IL3000]